MGNAHIYMRRFDAISGVISPTRIGKLTPIWYALTAIGKNKVACYFE